jgi:[ribosomal protein S5]-alanine N-acetyltransferase
LATGFGVSFQTDQLLLRDLQADDGQWLDQYFSEEESQQSLLRMQRGAQYGSDVASQYAGYASVVPFGFRTYIGFAVLLRDTLQPIGFCSLSHVAKRSQKTLLGWHFSGSFKGHGYATESCRELIRVAFEERGVAQVAADCYESSAASIRIFTKLGMRPASGLAVRKWLLAARYLEPKAIVRYAVRESGFRAAQLGERQRKAGFST